MHDPRMGKFLSTDPLEAQYVHNSPYAFAENRVIDGVELEGLEYLSSEDSRIEIKLGQVHLKLSNFHNSTLMRMRGRIYPNNHDRDPYGNEVIGVNTLLLDFHRRRSRLVPFENDPASLSLATNSVSRFPGQRLLVNALIINTEAEPLPPGENFNISKLPRTKDGSLDKRYRINRQYFAEVDRYYDELSEYKFRKNGTNRANENLANFSSGKN